MYNGLDQLFAEGINFTCLRTQAIDQNNRGQYEKARTFGIAALVCNMITIASYIMSVGVVFITCVLFYTLVR